MAKTDGDIVSFLTWCKDGLGKMDATAWETDLEGTCECVWLACNLADRGITLKLTTHLADALAEHAKSLAAGEHIPEEAVLERWQDLFGYLDGNVRKNLRLRLLGVAVDADGSLHEAFFQVYGGEIVDSEVLSRNDKTVPSLFEPLVRIDNVPGLRWMKDLFENNGTVLDGISSESEVEAFKTRLADRLSSGGENEAQTLVEKIAQSLGIKIAEDESEIYESEGDESVPAEG